MRKYEICNVDIMGRYSTVIDSSTQAKLLQKIKKHNLIKRKPYFYWALVRNNNRLMATASLKQIIYRLEDNRKYIRN